VRCKVWGVRCRVKGEGWACALTEEPSKQPSPRVLVESRWVGIRSQMSGCVAKKPGMSMDIG